MPTVTNNISSSDSLPLKLHHESGGKAVLTWPVTVMVCWHDHGDLARKLRSLPRPQLGCWTFASCDRFYWHQTKYPYLIGSEFVCEQHPHAHIFYLLKFLRDEILLTVVKFIWIFLYDDEFRCDSDSYTGINSMLLGEYLAWINGPCVVVVVYIHLGRK